MPCKSLGLFIGTGNCNAHCQHCAGVYYRQFAPKEDWVIPEELFRKTIREAYADGARSLTLSSGGEPTLSPFAISKTLRLVIKEDLDFNQINLYSNGIRIGEEEPFSAWLREWKNLGLTWVYVTVHNTDEVINAKMYGVEKYPSLKIVSSRIRESGLCLRANIMLTKDGVHDLVGFTQMVEELAALEFDAVAAWPIRGLDDTPNAYLAPSEESLTEIEEWITTGASRIPVRMSLSRAGYETGQKLTLFPNGVLSSKMHIAPSQGGD